jgi:2'-5' RNA ligase
MRLFAAIEISPEVRHALAETLAELRKVSVKQRWVAPENLHITLKFLGEVPNEQLESVTMALSSVRSQAAVTLEIAGLGFFPSERRPRVLWAGVAATPNLPPLAAAIDLALMPLGIPPNEHEFRPHLTLVRLRDIGAPAALSGAAKRAASRKFGTIQASAFQLFESKLGPRGATYVRLASFSFVEGDVQR